MSIKSSYRWRPPGYRLIYDWDRLALIYRRGTQMKPQPEELIAAICAGASTFLARIVAQARWLRFEQKQTIRKRGFPA
ncbi:hypothetical protein ACOJBM_40965 [Rhizobium beringeri]